MKKIGILGGTFDPPHNAHYEIARRAIEQFQLERVIFIPSGTPWQKDSKTSFEDRYKMTNLLIQDNNLFELSDIEKSEKNPSYTFETLNNLDHPKESLYFILGSDTAINIKTWKNYEQLSDLTHFLIALRSEDNTEMLKENFPFEYELIDGEKLNLSSSGLRKKLKENELKEIIENIKFKLPKDLNIPIIINHENNLKNYITKTISQYGEILLILNSLQLADKLFLQIKEQRLKRRQKLAQSTIGKFSTIKASAVALNPFILFDVAGSFALDTALISELSKIYGLNLKGESTRKIFKNISINNLCLGITQVGVNTSFNLIKKLILLTAPFTNGLSLLPYGPIAIIQAAIAIYSTKILGKLAAKEIFVRSKASFIEPAILIQNMNFNDPEIFNYINIYFSSRNLNNNFVSFLP